jgi:hypothetical protein
VRGLSQGYRRIYNRSLTNLCTVYKLPASIHTAGNGARAHGARAKAGAKSFFLSFSIQYPCKGILFIWLQVYSTISGIAALSMALHKLRNIPYVIHKIIRQVPIIHGTHHLVNWTAVPQ